MDNAELFTKFEQFVTEGEIGYYKGSQLIKDAIKQNQWSISHFILLRKILLMQYHNAGFKLFSIQEHHAEVAGLHWDFRMENRFGKIDSWVIKKGISCNFREKRLALNDPMFAKTGQRHDFESLFFEGSINETLSRTFLILTDIGLIKYYPVKLGSYYYFALFGMREDPIYLRLYKPNFQEEDDPLREKWLIERITEPEALLKIKDEEPKEIKTGRNR